MAVATMNWEAERIGDFIDKAPANLEPITLSQSITELDNGIEAFHNVPCTFLKDNQCTIYEVRPMACRTYFNVSQYPEICDFSLGDCDIPNIDSRAIQDAMVDINIQEVYQGKPMRDIRTFFPRGDY